MCSSGMQLDQFTLFKKIQADLQPLGVHLFCQKGTSNVRHRRAKIKCGILMKVDAAIAIIPARFNSTRFPGKALVEIDGKTLIEHVYRRVEQASLVERILVATDDRRIAGAVERFGGTAVMTRNDHSCGTDRLAEAAEGLDPNSLIVNVQG